MFKKKGLEEELECEAKSDSPEASQDAKASKTKIFKLRGKIKGKKKVAVIIVAAIVVLFLISKLVGGGEQLTEYVSTSEVELGNISKTVSLKGVIEGSDSASVYSNVNYNIKSVNVKTGDKVSVGQSLASLDAEALSNEYAKASVSLSESKRKYDSTKSLYEAGAVSKSEYLSAKADYDIDSLALSSLDIRQNSNILSPISGTVTRVNATVGKPSNASSDTSEPLFVVENLDKLQMKIKISEYDINYIQVGQTVTITSEVLGKKSLPGVVSHIAPTGEKKDASSAEMVVPVVIDVNNGGSELIAGVTAKAVILVAERKDVLTVPIDAILEDAETGKNYIFTVSDTGILSKKRVNIGLEGDLYVEISGKNISSGQKVLLSPTYEHTDGMQVSVSPGEQGADEI
ncbi:MAG: efflux RND transporter periplasmic adaptor subunit [Eubacteriales bacterium]|nr:efflux RND transporter periplasmic adaptor subunit [Eubacteriales bacterium]MDD4390543.1 efflux RND transporter periplasmic adaptor subunit [Eubacteriales bacterium]